MSHSVAKTDCLRHIVKRDAAAMHHMRKCLWKMRVCKLDLLGPQIKVWTWTLAWYDLFNLMVVQVDNFDKIWRIYCQEAIKRINKEFKIHPSLDYVSTKCLIDPLRTCQDISKVSRFRPLGIMNVFMGFLDNPSNSCWDMWSGAQRWTERLCHFLFSSIKRSNAAFNHKPTPEICWMQTFITE